MRRRGADELVAAVSPGAVDRRDLGVLGEGVDEVAVAFDHLPLDVVGVERRVRGERVHPLHQPLDRRGRHEVLAVVDERLHRFRGTGADPAEHLSHGLAGEVGVLLGAGEGELLLDDLLGQDEPRVVVAGLAQVGQRPESVEAREVRRRQPVAVAVEPHRRRSGQDPDGVTGPDRGPVVDALDVVPHPVAVDDRATGRLDDPDHPAVDVGGDAGRQMVGWGAEPLRPGRPHEVVVAADPARRDDHRRRGQGEVADDVAVRRMAAGLGRGGEHGSADTGHGPAVDDEVVHAVPEREGQQPVALGLDRLAHERFHDGWAGAPRDVEPGHRVAVPPGVTVTALRPADHREPAHALLVQPGALLTGREVDVGPRPQARPVVLRAVEAGRPEPVLPGELDGVLDAHPPLFGRVDEEQPAEGPERLAAEVGPRLLLHDDHASAGTGQLGGGDQAGEARADDDGIRVRHLPSLPLRRASPKVDVLKVCR